MLNTRHFLVDDTVNNSATALRCDALPSKSYRDSSFNIFRLQEPFVELQTSEKTWSTFQFLPSQAGTIGRSVLSTDFGTGFGYNNCIGFFSSSREIAGEFTSSD